MKPKTLAHDLSHKAPDQREITPTNSLQRDHSAALSKQFHYITCDLEDSWIYFSRIMACSKSNLSEPCSVSIFRVDVVTNRQSTYFSVLPSTPVPHWPANLQQYNNDGLKYKQFLCPTYYTYKQLVPHPKSTGIDSIRYWSIINKVIDDYRLYCISTDWLLINIDINLTVSTTVDGYNVSVDRRVNILAAPSYDVT